jgi:hypothetical protein
MRHTNNAVVPMNAMFSQQLVYHRDRDHLKVAANDHQMETTVYTYR